jgi:hypothetical protein
MDAIDAMDDHKPTIVKLKKNPEAPKRFKSAYMFFSSAMHKQIRTDPQHRKVSLREEMTYSFQIQA